MAGKASRAWPWLIAAIVSSGAASGCGGGSADAVAEKARSDAADYAIRIVTNSYAIGRYKITFRRQFSPNATLAGAFAAFGDDGSCIEPSGGRDWATHGRWPARGVTGDFFTLGAFEGEDGRSDLEGTGCEYRDQIYVSTLHLDDPRWHTDRGLHVGDSLRRMWTLYPDAKLEQEGWTLQTKSQEYGPPDATPQLIAVADGDRVGTLNVQIGAQGD